MTKRESVVVVALMAVLYGVAFWGGYKTARAKLDFMLEQGCRMHCQLILPMPPPKMMPPRT